MPRHCSVRPSRPGRPPGQRGRHAQHDAGGHAGRWRSRRARGHPSRGRVGPARSVALDEQLPDDNVGLPRVARLAWQLRRDGRCRGRVDRLVCGRARALPTPARRQGRRGQPAACAYSPAGRQERPDRCGDGRPPVPGWQGQSGPEADRRDRRVDPAAARRAAQRGEVPQRRTGPGP